MRLASLLALVAAPTAARALEPPTGHLLIVNRNQTGSLLEPDEVSYSLDDAEVLHLGGSSERIRSPEFPVLDRALTVGVHTVSVVLDYRGRRVGVFNYLSNYKIRIRLHFRIVIDDGKPTEVAVTSYLKEGALLKFEERPAGRYLIARSLKTAAGQSDRDKDNVADDFDACPDLPGSTAAHGCPDKDGDGIADKDDRCPTEPETFNGYQDQDGCPDEMPDGAASAAVTPAAASVPKAPVTPESTTEVFNPTKITSLLVYFDFNVDQLSPAFAHKLDEIAEALRDHPEIHRLRIEGHTDFLGSDEYNQSLSERRAAAVASYLAGKSIDASRLDAVGYGRTRPRDTGKGADARAHNRRVEFVIIE